MSYTENNKRAAPSTPPWEKQSKDHRRNQNQRSPRPHAPYNGAAHSQRAPNHEENFARELTRRNQIQEAEQMREWVAKEDEFVLKQSKKKAKIRVKEGRARTIDWLAVTLNALGNSDDLLEDEGEAEDMEVIDPSGVFEGLDSNRLRDLEKDISTYMALETSRQNLNYWNALKVICQHFAARAEPTATYHRTNVSVAEDIDRLLSPKTLVELKGLEKQISAKLQSNEPIDVEYWEQLKTNVGVYKAKAELKAIYGSIVQNRLHSFRREQRAEASSLKMNLASVLEVSRELQSVGANTLPNLDPEPELRIRSEDKHLEVIEEKDFVDRFHAEKQRIVNSGYMPSKQSASDKKALSGLSKPVEASTSGVTRPTTVAREDFSSATNALYEREVARGVQEDEEIFAGEEEVQTKANPQWAGKYRPRKPRYFNRVQMGYEWNKYNQTHYDHDNPPPKVVQGYKFNIFYPDLIDKIKAPTYRIEREGGRKRGESFAPAGEEDTCLIRFISGPPYEDIAFRIVDKEWDFSAKRERGFRSSFDKGILQLHFQFKKVYYRK